MRRHQILRADNAETRMVGWVANAIVRATESVLCSKCLVAGFIVCSVNLNRSKIHLALTMMEEKLLTDGKSNPFTHSVTYRPTSARLAGQSHRYPDLVEQVKNEQRSRNPHEIQQQTGDFSSVTSCSPSSG